MVKAAPIDTVISQASSNSLHAIANADMSNDFFATTHNKIKARSGPMCENCRSCTAKQTGIPLITSTLRYDLHIGAPFANGAGCGPIETAFEEDPHTPDFAASKCKDDGYGMTKISFVALRHDRGWEISKFLNVIYPEVRRHTFDGFNCPQE